LEEFSLVKVEGMSYNPFTGGCFGMSIAMVDHILRRNGYRLIEAAHANIIAVHEDVAHLFEDRPQDPWFWFQSVKSGLYHSHWMGGGRVNADTNSPLSLYGEGTGFRTQSGPTMLFPEGTYREATSTSRSVFGKHSFSRHSPLDCV